MDKNNELKRIGIRISYLRRLRNWDQETLASNIGITRSYVSRIESGNSIDGVPLSLYMSIADALGTPIWKLLKVDE